MPRETAKKIGENASNGRRHGTGKFGPSVVSEGASKLCSRRAHRPRRGERTTPQHVAVASAASAALAATVGGSRRIIRHPAGMTVYYHLGMSDEYLYAHSSTSPCSRSRSCPTVGLAAAWAAPR